MNLDNIKSKMESDIMDDQIIPQNIKELKTTQLPLQKVRRNLRNEILTQILVFICLFIIPSFLKINEIAKGLYFVLLFIITLITVTYLLKMSVFLKRNSDISTNSKQVLINIIHELNLTLEVYKTAIVSGSLILPLLAFVVFTGKAKFEESLLYDIITFNISSNHLILYIVGYLLISILIMYITNWWTNHLYGKYIKTIEKTLDQVNAG